MHNLHIAADVKGILLAEEVIAINQDPLGVAGDLMWKQGPNEVSRCCHSDLERFQRDQRRVSLPQAGLQGLGQ